MTLRDYQERDLDAVRAAFREHRAVLLVQPTGAGKGTLASQFDPPPRNCQCATTVNGIPDGQLAWIVRNGSPGTSMVSNPVSKFSDQEIWQIVAHLRQLARN